MKKNYLLIIILIVASIIRFWQLGNIPPSPDWDEAALGYNAYSILKTGRDEYGNFFPVTLRSFDDYKPPLYMYLAVPFVGLFGLNTWSVRLPAVLSGILAVMGTYYLVYQLQLQSGRKMETKNIENTALLSSLLLAISPWHIQFSRIAFEAGIGVTINIWAIYFFLKGLSRINYLNLAAFLFGLSLYAYHSERIFAPLMVILLTAIYRKEVFRYKKRLVLPIAIGLLTILPLLQIFTDGNTLMRLKGTSSLSDQTGLLSRSVKKLEDDMKRGDVLGEILDNRRVVWVKTLAAGYLTHFSLKWWFVNGDNPRHHAPDTGMLYLWEMPFLFAGMLLIFRKKGKAGAVIFSWFLISPIAASPTTELPHGIRTLVFLPSFQIFTATGILGVWQYVSRKIQFFSGLFVFTYAAFIICNTVYYFHMYFVHYNYEYSQYWQYGYKQAVAYAQENYSQYRKIVVSTELEQPHMFFLFYTAYDPGKYLKEGGTASGGFAEVKNKFDKYEFRPVKWDKEKRDGSVLYIAGPEEINTAPLITINYLDGSEAIKIADK